MTPVVSAGNLEQSGDVLHLALPLTALSATLLIEDDYQGMWQLAATLASSRVGVEALKYTVDKDRPDGSGNDSFPSGHSADSFAAATFIYRRYGWEYGVPAYVASSYVAYSRVASDKHETSDVLAGAAIGALAGWYFTQPFKGVNITPIAYNGTYGVYVSGQF
ncbi:phosphatase PAP2 family protein [Shewanella intestini]|nr:MULTISPECIES: phosphatase PAP2 family protein [Shewanella]